MTEYATEGTPEQEQGKAMKRRGLIAGAAALVGGMVAKQVAEESPVSANDGTWTFPYLGTTSFGSTAFIVVNTSGAGIRGEGSSGDGVYGNSTSGNGVSGTSSSNYGVSGISSGNHGVNGKTNAPLNSGGAGVQGLGNGDGTFGVLGSGFAGTGVGVQGQSDAVDSVGVQGISGAGFPIIGKVFGTGSVINPAAGVLGAGTIGPGVQGQSTSGHGLVGTTSASDGHAGLIGRADTTGGVGLMGIAPNYGTMSVGRAGDFYGNVKITGGTLSAPMMQAVVPHAGDNTYRALHTVASPEGWFEDFGEGTLVADKADVKLEPDFAALVHTDAYHVFLTPDGPHHLHVSQKSAAGFSVVATAIGAAQAGGPKRPEGGGTFSYRVVAKRKDIVGERLAKVAAPTSPKVPTAFTLPETPEVKPPTKKP